MQEVDCMLPKFLPAGDTTRLGVAGRRCSACVEHVISLLLPHLHTPPTVVVFYSGAVQAGALQGAFISGTAWQNEAICASCYADGLCRSGSRLAGPA